jgi:hypothetical protein
MRVQTFKLASNQCIKPSVESDNVVNCFHIKLQNQDEALIVNNLPLESYRECI